MLITKDGIVEPSVIVLSTVGGKLLGAIPNINNSTVNIRLAMKDASEISFDVYKVGDETDHLWKSITDFKLIWVRSCNMVFQISVKVDEKVDTVKHVTGKSLGHSELSQILLRNIEINTEEDILRDDYSPTVLYSEDKSSSLIDRLLEKAPHYSVGHVDDTIANVQRSFNFDKKSIADAFNEVSEEIGCLFKYSTTFVTDEETGSLVLSRVINVYDLQNHCLDCGSRIEGDVCQKCGSSNVAYGYGKDTGIFVSVDNLSDQIQYNVDVDSVKNCFALEAGDDLMTAVIRSTVPSGDGYLWYLNDAVRSDMSDELNAKLTEYDALYEEKRATERYSVDSSEYNLLVDKYHDAEDIKKIFSGGDGSEDAIYLNGFSNVLAAYYNASGMKTYLKTTMMPEVTITGSTAQEEIDKLVALDSIALSDVKPTTSSATLETAIKSIVKMFIKSSAYNVIVATASGGWEPDTDPTRWNGSITLTAWKDSSDTATITDKSFTVSDNLADYLTEALTKELASNEDYNIVDLFNSEDFADELRRYGADSLDEFYQIATACTNILIEYGCGDEGHNLHEMYTKWYNKLGYIQSELDLRGEEIATVDKIISDLQIIIDDVHASLNMQSFLGPALYAELAAFRREDTYSNDNYISDGLSDIQLIENANSFIDAAQAEIYKSANLQHKITASLHNLMLIPEFEPLLDNFDTGNWIMLRVDENLYRLRLILIGISYGTLDKITVEFSDTVNIKTGLSDIKSILSSASSIATSYGAVTRQAEKGSVANGVVSDWVNDGMSLTNTKLYDSSTETKMSIDQNGILLRGYDALTETPTQEQVRLTNRTIAFTDDNWETTRSAVGRFYYYDPEDGTVKVGYGVIADTIVGNLVLSKQVGVYNEDGTIKLDDAGITIMNAQKQPTFKVDTDGNISLLGNIVWGEASVPVTHDAITGALSAAESAGSDGLYAYTDDDGNKFIGLNLSAAVIGKIKAGSIEAGSITLNELTADTLDGEHGSINLHDGTFAYWNQDETKGISWDGNSLSIKGGVNLESFDDAVLIEGEDGTTKIDGGVIDTESLFAQNIKATETFEVDNDYYRLIQNDDGGFDLSTKSRVETESFHGPSARISLSNDNGIVIQRAFPGTPGEQLDHYLSYASFQPGMTSIGMNRSGYDDDGAPILFNHSVSMMDNGIIIEGMPFISYGSGDQTAPMVDFIIEESSVEGWSYKKYKSGRVELDCRYEVSNMTCTTTMGSLYRTSGVNPPDFPFPVYSPIVTCGFDTRSTGAILWARSAATTTAPPHYYLARHDTTSISGYVNLHVVGSYVEPQTTASD